MLSSIRTRLTLTHLVVIVVAMGLSGFLLLSLLEQYFLQAMEESLVAQARITAQALVPGALAEGPPPEIPASAFNTIQQRGSNIALQAENIAPQVAEDSLGDVDLGYLADASLQLSTQLDTRIRILDTDGMVLVDSYQLDSGADLGEDSLVSQALSGQYASRTSTSDGQAAMDLVLPVQIDGRLVGAVFLSQPLQDALAVVYDLRMRWLISTLVALIFSGLVGLLFSRAIARPLHRLTDAAGAVAQGDLEYRVPVRSRDELGRLSGAFNDMVARLRAARQTQVDFVANVSHELRTPLTAIKGTVETLRDGAVDDPKVRDLFLETIETETDRLIRLVNDLLILTRVDSEALVLQLAEVDLLQLAEGVVSRLAPKAEAEGLVLQVQQSTGEGMAWADPDRVEQVLVNLLDNAIKYSLPGGTVTVEVGARPPENVLVQVRDEGIGIPAEELDRVGERFYRADKARSRAEGGSGLGLAIARALVQAHGGSLWLESREGSGTFVAFTLPAP